MALIHILDKQSDEIIGTLNIGEYTDDEKVTSSENENTFDFTALKKFDLLQKRNRLLLQDKDGFFSEYLIIYAEQNSRNQKFIKSNATFTDLQKSKIIEPQVLQGATADTATTKALEGTEWRKGRVDYNGIRTIKIEEYTNPYNLLKQIASEFGLDLRFRVAVEGNKIARYVDLTFPDDKFDGKEVVFGKDLIGLRRIEDAQNIVTALLVLGPEQEDGTQQTVLVEDNDALQRWGRNGQHLIEVYEPQITAEEVTIERLRTLGQNALQKRIDALVTYECQAAILEHIPGKEHEKVRLDMTIRIKDDGYTPPLYLEAKVLEIKEQPSTGKLLEFKLGNYKEFSKTDLEEQIARLKKQLNDKLSKLVQVSVTSSAGTVFKNGTGETDLTAVTFLGGKEVDTDGLFYDYVWSKYDKNGNFVGATSGKSITVYARNIDEKETYIVTVENQGAKSIGQITVTNVNDGEQGPQGPKGPPGVDGVSSYTHIAYANSADGTVDFSTTESLNKTYIGIYVDNEPMGSTDPTKYNWTLIKGADGERGLPGPPGADGKTSYLHIAYAQSADGSVGFSLTDPTNATYIGTYTDFTPEDSQDPTSYTWAKFQGPKGDQGPQGVQGPKGADGQSLYTWIKYADSPTSGMSDTPDGKKYIGLAYNKTTPTESSNYADYSWSLIQGPQGVQGPKGADGQTLYTWIKYADNEFGDGMSDDPTGKMYIGIAYNKTTATESTNPADYTWSAMYDTEKLEEVEKVANDAKDIADNARATADEKNTVFYQATAPSTVGRKVNDLWYDTDDGYKPYYFNGSSWIPAPFGNAAIANLDVGKIVGDQGNFNWLEAKHIKSLNGLNVGNGQFVVDENGNVNYGGNLEGASGTFGQVTVKDGDFYLEDTNSSTKYSIVQKGNLIKDHSFELVWTLDEQEDSVTHFWLKMFNTWASNSDWEAVGTPMVGLSGMHGPAPSAARPIFGDQAIIVNASNYVYQSLWKISGNATYTISAFAKRAYNLSLGALRIEVYRVSSDTYGNITETLLKAQNFSGVASDYKVARYSMTFTTPAMSQSDYLKIIIKGANNNWVHVDGVQLVENSSPVVYADETSTWDIIKGKFDIKTTQRILWAGVAFVTDTQYITPTKSLEQCKIGWVLVWSEYWNGKESNSAWQYTFIPKYHSQLIPENEYFNVMLWANGYNVRKILYISEGFFRGHADNSSGNNSNAVLRYVIEV